MGPPRMEFLSPDTMASLIVASHAVERYRERSGVKGSNAANVVAKLKEIVQTGPAVEGKDNTHYVRAATGNGGDPIWVVVQGRVIRTVISHSQYIESLAPDSRWARHKGTTR